MAGIQYLDELFSAVRDTAEQLTLFDTWLMHLNTQLPLAWRMSILQTAQGTLNKARKRFDEAQAQLAALGPRDQLPSLLATMPDRLVELQQRLEMAEKAMDSAWTMAWFEPNPAA